FLSPSPHTPALPSFPTRRSSDLVVPREHGRNWHLGPLPHEPQRVDLGADDVRLVAEHPDIRWRSDLQHHRPPAVEADAVDRVEPDRKSTRLNSSHSQISYAVFCL